MSKQLVVKIISDGLLSDFALPLFPDICVPLHLFLLLLLSGLGFHLLYLNRVRLAATHVQLVVTHAQLQDALVYAQSRGIKHKVLKFGGEKKNKIKKPNRMRKREKLTGG